MGTDYYSYIVAGVEASKYIIQEEYIKKIPIYKKIGDEEIQLYDEGGKPVLRFYRGIKWLYNDVDYFDFRDLMYAIRSKGLDVVTRGCEAEIKKNDVIGLVLSVTRGSTISDLNLIERKIKEVKIILESIGIEEEPQIFNILHIDY